ncbi:hypothetical protein GCM10010428_77930 [Actinosynnema pretiosum subsp. pretiosum]
MSPFPLTPSPRRTGPESPAVTISYAHDAEGKRVAAYVKRGLAERGVRAVWDRDLRTPRSLPLWMANVLEKSIIITVLSPDYAKHFQGSGSEERKGVQFEGMLISSRLFEHVNKDKCPIIPVCAPGFDMNTRPFVIKGLDVTQLSCDSPNSDKGMDKLVDRIYDAFGEDPTTSSEHDLVSVWHKSLDQKHEAEPFCFPVITPAIRASGDVELMEQVTERCLELIGTGELDLDQKRLKAEILISGRAWCRRARGAHDQALRAAQEGVKLAEECDAEEIAAKGKRCQAKILRKMAESAWGAQRRENLDEAVRLARDSMAVFMRIDRYSNEAAACRSTLAKISFVRFRHGWRRALLRQAESQAAKAARELGIVSRRAKYDVAILRAEIAIERHKFDEAQEILTKMHDELVPLANTSCAYEELLARVRLTRAVLCHRANRFPGDGVLLQATLESFTGLGLAEPAAECRWLLHAMERSLSHRVVRSVERWCPDPALREKVVAAWEHTREIKGRRWTTGRRWRAIVSRVRNQDLG